MSLVYGVDSRVPASTRLTNGYNLYEWVMRMSCFPSFWGRSLTGDGAITSEEIEFLKRKKCKIALIVRDLIEEIISSNNAEKDSQRVIEIAKNLGVPQEQGIALFAEIPSHWSVNHNWMIDYANNLLNSGYIPGFIGNTDSSKNFNFGRQCSHYVQATRKNDQLHAVYCSTEPKYKFEPESWAPYAPSQLLPNDIHLWQYGKIKFHSLKVNKCYARDEAVTKCFWSV